LGDKAAPARVAHLISSPCRRGLAGVLANATVQQRGQGYNSLPSREPIGFLQG